MRTIPMHRRVALSRLLLIALESGSFSSVDFFAEVLMQVV